MDPMGKNFLEKMAENWLSLCIHTYGNMLEIAENLTQLGKAHHDSLKKDINKDGS
jgi:membrane-associated PAP2 superfamily phosphatase